jgi:hypothetical protein
MEEGKERCVALELAKDLITRLFCQLDCIDLMRCSLACRQWYADSAELREAWKAEYMEACTVRGFNVKKENYPPFPRLEAYISGSLD